MCGLFGIVGGAELGDPLDVVRRGLDALAHRGPDGRGAVLRRGKTAWAALGAVRLAILDRSPRADQPMVSADERFTLAFNGEVVNFPTLRAELGGTFRSTGDTAVVLAAIERWGPVALERLAGMFALAVWDAEAETLLLARDALGIKPLYVVDVGDGLAFSSEVRALLASGVVARRLDLGSVDHYLATGSAPAAGTIIDGVRSIAPGTLVVWRARGRIEERRYWAPGGGAVAREAPSPAELAATVRLSVQEHLASDVPMAVFLSGGVDSAAVLAAAGRDIAAVTLALDEPGSDESEAAAATARRAGVEHVVVRVRGADAMADLAPALMAMDQPSHDGLNTWFVARAARQAGFVVALAGTGGDELFAGYGSFRTLDRHLRWAGAAGVVPRRFAQVARSAVALRALPGPIRKGVDLLGGEGGVADLHRVTRQLFGPAERALLLGRRAPPAEPDRQTMASTVDPVEAWASLELERYLVATQLRDVDAMTMAHGLELRVPLLDRRVADAALAVPGPRRVTSPAKAPLRLVDPAVVPNGTEPKQGFVLPFDEWLRGPMRSAVEDRLLGPEVERAGLDRRTTARAWALHCRSPRLLNGSRVMALVSLVDWCDRHRVS